MKSTQESDVEAYAKNVPFPFSASRAKGRGFDFEGRRKAGLSEALIEYVRTARAYEQPYAAQQVGALLFPNLGGEEGESWKEMRWHPEVERVVLLWRLLFGREGRVLNDPCPHEMRSWPAALTDAQQAGDFPSEKAFDWLENSGRVVPWLATQEVEAYCAARKLRLAAAPWQVVERLHDKAFAQRAAREAGLDAPEVQNLIHVLEPELLRDGVQANREIERIVASWPEWARADFTLKPRLGSSGRGRLRGLAGKLALENPQTALQRLAQRGGAILEAWFAREQDFSVQLHIAATGEIEVLAVLCQLLTPAGLYRGHRGIVTREQAIRSGTSVDEALTAKARVLGQKAFEAGYTGPCGMDAFSYRDAETGETKLRCVVEWNSRFTTGTIVTGLLRKALRTPAIVDWRQGESCAFLFSLDPPSENQTCDPSLRTAPRTERARGAQAAERRWPDDSDTFRCLLLTPEDELETPQTGPALCLARSAEELSRNLGR